MKLSKLKMNPNNPRKIAPHALQKLMDSIERDPDFMVLRPIVYDPETMQVLGGNQRLAALRKLGHKDIPDQWAVPAENLTPEQKRRFVLADNGQFGEWDFDILEMEWGDLELADWGIELPEMDVKYDPVINPNVAINEISDDDIKNANISPRTQDAKEYRDVICPRCGEEFTVEK